MTGSPADVVQRQLEAYNRRDLDAFCAVYAEDAQLFELGEGTPVTAGKAAIRERYRTLFDNSPQLYSAVLNRTALGRVVVDLERITGRNSSPKPMDFLAIYEVTGGLIVRCHFVRA